LIRPQPTSLAHGRVRPSSGDLGWLGAGPAAPLFFFFFFRLQLIGLGPYNANATHVQSSLCKSGRNLGRRRAFGPAPKPAWAETKPVDSWPLDLALLNPTVWRASRKYKIRQRRSVTQNPTSFAPTASLSFPCFSLPFVLLCHRSKNRKHREDNSRRRMKSGAAPRPLAGARALPLRSAPPSSGFVCGTLLERRLWRSARRVESPAGLGLPRSSVTRRRCGDDRDKVRYGSPPTPAALPLCFLACLSRVRITPVPRLDLGARG
jgi:hypothetical protein